MNRSSFEDHRVGEQISVVDAPSTSESISKKVNRLFTFKRDKKNSAGDHQRIVIGATLQGVSQCIQQ